MNTTETVDETGILNGHIMTEIGDGYNSSDIFVMVEEVARQIKAMTEPLLKQQVVLCDMRRNLRQSTLWRNEKTSISAQGSSSALKTSSDSESVLKKV